MSDRLTEVAIWLGTQGNLVLPLLLTMWVAWGDVRTHRIPNHLTLGIALTGLAYQLAFHGGWGLLDGFLGLLLGFAFLILPYILGGMGAGDVKAVAALGAWLGPWHTLLFCCCMGIAGGLLALGYLGWKGQLIDKLRQGWGLLLNWVLSRPPESAPASPRAVEAGGLPYGLAIALGMAALVCIGA